MHHYFTNVRPKGFVLPFMLMVLLCSQVTAAVDCPFAKTILTNEDYAAVKDCSSIQALTVQSPNIPALSFPQLATISGALIVDSCATTASVDMPLLTTIGGVLQIINNPVLKTISIPQNCSVNGQLMVSGNGALTAVTLGVSSVVDTIIEDNLPTKGKTWTLVANSLTSTGSFSVFNNTGLASAQFNGLQRVGSDMTISTNPQLTKFSATSPMTVGGALTISANPLLSSLVVNPTTITGSLILDSNGATGTGNWNLTVNGLTSVDQVEIKNNGKFTGISMNALTSVTKGFSLSTNIGMKQVKIPGPFPVGDALTIAGNQGTTMDVILGASDVKGVVAITANTGVRSLMMNELTVIGDNMIISGSTISILSANKTFTVKAGVSISDNTGFTNVNLNGLYAIANGGFSFINNKSPAANVMYPLSLNGLTLVRGNIAFSTNLGLGSLSMNSLAVVGSSFAPGTNNPPLANNATGDVAIFDNDKLTTVTIGVSSNNTGNATNNPSFFTVSGNVIITNNAALKSVIMDGVVRIGGDVSVNKNTLAQLSMKNLACVNGMTFADNVGIKSISLTSLTSITQSIKFAPAQVQGCQMCVGSDPTDCATCGACVSCVASETCGNENVPWKNSCATSSGNSTCPTVMDPTTPVDESTSFSEDSTTDSSVETDPSDMTDDTSEESTESSQDLTSEEDTSSTENQPNPTEEQEGAAFQLKTSDWLLATIFVFAVCF